MFRVVSELYHEVNIDLNMNTIKIYEDDKLLYSFIDKKLYNSSNYIRKDYIWVRLKKIKKEYIKHKYIGKESTSTFKGCDGKLVVKNITEFLELINLEISHSRGELLAEPDQLEILGKYIDLNDSDSCEHFHYRMNRLKEDNKDLFKCIYYFYIDELPIEVRNDIEKYYL